jgi:hypothetical protein
LADGEWCDRGEGKFTTVKLKFTLLFVVIIIASRGLYRSFFDCSKMACPEAYPYYEGVTVETSVNGGPYSFAELLSFFVTPCNIISSEILPINIAYLMILGRIALSALSIIVFYILMCIVMDRRSIKSRKKS